jgi:hypothetical protein
MHSLTQRTWNLPTPTALNQETGRTRYLPRNVGSCGDKLVISVAGSNALHLQATWMSEELQLTRTLQLHLMAYKLHVCGMEHFIPTSITISACFASRFCQLYVLGIYFLSCRTNLVLNDFSAFLHFTSCLVCRKTCRKFDLTSHYHQLKHWRPSADNCWCSLSAI